MPSLPRFEKLKFTFNRPKMTVCYVFLPLVTFRLAVRHTIYYLNIGFVVNNILALFRSAEN
jgi:hypothetical protein